MLILPQTGTYVFTLYVRAINGMMRMMMKENGTPCQSLETCWRFFKNIHLGCAPHCAEPRGPQTTRRAQAWRPVTSGCRQFNAHNFNSGLASQPGDILDGSFPNPFRRLRFRFWESKQAPASTAGAGKISSQRRLNSRKNVGHQWLLIWLQLRMRVLAD